MAKQPKVFISYSYDSPEHRRWVLKLGTQLYHNGVDVILDQWDLSPGQNWSQFIVDSVRDADRILVIYTDSYVRKAYAGEGGVGYEWQIATKTEKVIPIIREASAKQKMPRDLGEQVYIDFTNESQFDEKFVELLHELRQVPVAPKSSLEKPPFSQLPEIPEQVESASDAYLAAVQLARAGDVLGWRQLIKRIKPITFNSLVQWRQNELDGRRPEHKEQLTGVVDKAVDIISPLISVALAGVESGREQFRDQKSLLDDLLNIAGWNPAGYTIWVNLPNALGYVYHSLHGSLGLSTNQLDLALNLARVKFPVADRTKFLHVWQRSELRGYAQSISGTRGGNSVESWEYLAGASERWEWLPPIFGTELEYRTSLVAYYMALNIHELATVIASGQQGILNTSSEYYFHIPLTFLSETYYTTERALSLLLRNPGSLMGLWTSLNVTYEQMAYSWGDWIRLSENQLARYGLSFIAHQNLSDIFRYLFAAL